MKRSIWIGLIITGLLITATVITLVVWDFDKSEDAPVQTTTIPPTGTSNGPTTSTTTQSPTIFYKAAVVEYERVFNPTKPVEEAQANLERYLEIINSQTVTGVDILVFPEGGLNNFGTAQVVPEVDDRIVLCDSPDFDDILSTLSCHAIKRNMYLVVNVIEKSSCPDQQQIRLNDPRPCAPSGVNYYNSNVVFDRSGRVVAKYRKFNLFNEPGILQPFKSEVSKFTTDLGVTFGIFTCFDILFKQPAFDLVTEGITDFIMTTWWFSELPYLTGVQTQQAWASTHNVNLIASGLTNPDIGSSGSGIYHGKSFTLRSTIQGVAGTEVLIAVVPSIGYTGIPNLQPPVQRSPQEMMGLTMLKDQVENFQYRLITGGSQFNLCHDGFCCEFYIVGNFNRTGGGKYYEYQALVYHGVRSFSGAAEANVKICGIAACTSMDHKSCGDRFGPDEVVDERFRFDLITIEGDFGRKNERLLLPSSVDTSILPLRWTEFDVTEKGNKVMLTLNSRRSNLLGFGLYGVVY